MNETWESTTDSTVWVVLVTARGLERHVAFKKRGARMQIPTSDRLEMQAVNSDGPFTNGLLVRVDADQQRDPETATKHVFSDDDLRAKLATSVSVFAKWVPTLNELNFRRLRDLAEDDPKVTAGHAEVINRVLTEKWRKDGAMPSYEDTMMRGAR